MNIQYYHNGETTIGKAVNNSIAPAGVPEFLIALVALDPKVSKHQKQILMNHADMSSVAAPRGNDQYDELVGKHMVRDKLVVKQCDRDLHKLNILEKWLVRMLDLVCDLKEQLLCRKLRAANRMDSVFYQVNDNQ